MAVYKVPQDVEAEDKLIGPFSFRQFIYLIVAALGIFLAWALSRIFIGLLIIPLPVVVAFLALALPLRKDQPMETYLTAMIKFFFKPRHRLWDPEGTISLVQITAAKVAEGPQLKDVKGDDAGQRLAYLAQVVDTQGWATRGAMSPSDGLNELAIVQDEAEDILDSSSGVAQSIDQRINETDNARLNAVREQFQSAVQAAPTSTNEPNPATEEDIAAIAADLHYSPYPAIHQHVIDPQAHQQTQPIAPVKPELQKQPSTDTVSPDIMRLANTKDLSISALSREAHRLEDDGKEVVIPLR